ncbi:hypothetical protein B0H14DRAFT_983562 [Mycena olivaceomarginata]|nr:hypothetical protein B0H14DRAFT_983562 [Mycena olivaceomarginata]
MTISSGVLCFPYLAKRWAVARPIRIRSHRNYLRSCAAFLLARALLLLHFPCHDPLPSSLCILCVTIRCTTSLGRASPACVPASPSTTCHGTWQKYRFRSCMYHRLGTLCSSACFPPPSCSPLGLWRPCDHLHRPPATPMRCFPTLLAPNWPLSVFAPTLRLGSGTVFVGSQKNYKKCAEKGKRKGRERGICISTTPHSNCPTDLSPNHRFILGYS